MVNYRVILIILFRFNSKKATSLPYLLNSARKSINYFFINKVSIAIIPTFTGRLVLFPCYHSDTYSQTGINHSSNLHKKRNK